MQFYHEWLHFFPAALHSRGGKIILMSWQSKPGEQAHQPDTIDYTLIT